MSENYRRLAVVAPKTTTQFNQFLPSKDKQSGYVPAPLRKKRTDSTGNDGNRRSWASPMFTEEDGSFSSQKKSGSSSEDSDCDVSPQLCVSSPPHSEPPTSHAQTSAQLSPNTPSSPTTQPHMPTEETSTARRLQLPDFWPRPDPTSGPRLIKCKRHPLLGRDHPSDPYNVSEDIFPDLENDDMFSRRTYAFHSNTELADVKYGGLLSLHHRSESSIRVVTQPSDARSTYPDLEKDDVVTRRFQRQSIRPSLSGGPDEYHPVPIPELWALPQKLQSKISPPCPPEQEAAQVYGDQKGAKHHKTDDMLVRRLGTVQNPTEVSQRSGGTQAGPSVPSFCSEEDLQKWQDIREASRLRYKKRLMVERLGF